MTTAKISARNVLADITYNDSHEKVKQQALKNIYDEITLKDIAFNYSEENIRMKHLSI